MFLRQTPIVFAAILLCAPAWSQSAAPDRDVSWKSLIPNIFEDQQEIWTFPARLAHGDDLAPTLGVAGVTASVMLLADPPEAQYFRNSNSFKTYNAIFASNPAAITTALVPVAFYFAGMAAKSERTEKTALFEAEALADVEIVDTVLKQITDRLRPSSIAKNGDFGDSFTDGGPRIVRNGGSFPSGHTIAAFALATIISRRYPEHRWVPIVAYGVAAAVGFSRLTLSAHFASDVLFGGVLGYSISRFSVLRQ